MDAISAEIARTERYLRELRERKAQVNPDANEILLATRLHTLLCTSNHADQCGWEYEVEAVNPWGTWTHAKYLTLARKVYSECSTISTADINHVLAAVVAHR